MHAAGIVRAETDREGDDMTAGMILLLGIGAALAVLMLFVLLRMAGDQERNRRDMQRQITPHVEYTITGATSGHTRGGSIVMTDGLDSKAWPVDVSRVRYKR